MSSFGVAKVVFEINNVQARSKIPIAMNKTMRRRELDSSATAEGSSTGMLSSLASLRPISKTKGDKGFAAGSLRLQVWNW